VSSSSLIRWLETSTARPWAASARRKPRSQLAHAEGVAAGLAPDHGPQPRLVDDLVDPGGGQALGAGEPEQVVAGGPARLQRGGVKQRPDVAERAPQGAVRPPVDQRGARVGRVQAEDDPHRG
jgi:hypothetical protein